MVELLKKKETIEFLKINEKEFDNYFKNSNEIEGEKKGNRWFFDKDKLLEWSKLKKERTVMLSLNEYEKCFEFAIKMVYGGLALHGMRGKRSEVQAADDVILGILGEYSIKKFLKENFRTEIELDEEVHTEEITPQDIIKIKINGKWKNPRLDIGIKGSKMKNGFLVLGSNEVERKERHSDAYIFIRIGLPSDHLFRILRDHSFFKKVKDFLDKKVSQGNNKFRKINILSEIPVWICGYVYDHELEKKDKIPGQNFDGYRYVKSVSKMHNSDKDWKELLKKL